MKKIKVFVLVMMLISLSLIFMRLFLDIPALLILIFVAISTLGSIFLYFFNNEKNGLVIIVWFVITTMWMFISYNEYNQKIDEKYEKAIEMHLIAHLKNNVGAPMNDSSSRDPELARELEVRIFSSTQKI